MFLKGHNHKSSKLICTGKITGKYESSAKSYEITVLYVNISTYFDLTLNIICDSKFYSKNICISTKEDEKYFLNARSLKP